MTLPFSYPHSRAFISFTYTLAKEISYREAERALKERLKRAPSAEEALRLLDDIVPDVPPAPEDEMPHANTR